MPCSFWVHVVCILLFPHGNNPKCCDTIPAFIAGHFASLLLLTWAQLQLFLPQRSPSPALEAQVSCISPAQACVELFTFTIRDLHIEPVEILDHSANHISVSALNPLWLAKTTTRGRKVNMATLRVQALTCPQRHQQLLREKTTLHYRIILYINIMCFFMAKNNYCCSYAWSASQVGAFVAGSCNPDNASILIKGLIKHFLLLNEYLISQRVSAAANCGETQRTN